jgi:hypothetical protein
MCFIHCEEEVVLFKEAKLDSLKMKEPYKTIDISLSLERKIIMQESTAHIK